MLFCLEAFFTIISIVFISGFPSFKWIEFYFEPASQSQKKELADLKAQNKYVKMNDETVDLALENTIGMLKCLRIYFVEDMVDL